MAVVAMDMFLFLFVGWQFSYGYLFSFFLVVIVAVLVACIPSRLAQLVIFSLFLGFGAVILVANYIAQTQLDELFNLENLFAMREVMAGADSVTLTPFLQGITAGMIVLIFFSVSLYLTIVYRKNRAGFRWKGLVASLGVLVVVGAAFGGTFAAMPARPDNLVDGLSSKRMQLNSFNFNRHMFMRNFGPTMFYARNFIEIIGLGPSFDSQGLYGDHVFSEFRPGDHPLPDNVDFLNRDYNLVMLMMEAVELAAVNPHLMPNLWDIKSRSSWVDGFYGHERTHPSEYSALTGSHLSGQEMWINFPDVYRPHALPQIFRSAGHDQIIAFHPYYNDFYGRSRMARPDRMGFDRQMDMRCFGEDIHFSMELNSDYHFFDTMLDTMIPDDRTFFSYILPIGTHTPHMTSRAVFPRRDANGRIVLDEYGRHMFATVPQFQQSFDEVMGMIEYMEDLYPRLAEGSDKERRGVMAYLVTLRDFDRGLGLMLERLRTTPDFRNPSRMLIETTAIVLYTDHYNYGVTIEPYNSGRGGLLGDGSGRPINGERNVFAIFNPRDPLATAPVTHAFDINQIGRPIRKFSSIIDVYRTVTHLFNITTNDRFTNGTSVFTDIPSVGIGFITGFIYGICERTGLPWRTRDMVNFEGVTPSAATLAEFRPRLEQHLATILHLRPLYERNAFATTPASWYFIP